MRRTAPDLLDEDLVRLLALGGDIGQIAEAAGTGTEQVLQRLGEAKRRADPLGAVLTAEAMPVTGELAGA